MGLARRTSRHRADRDAHLETRPCLLVSVVGRVDEADSHSASKSRVLGRGEGTRASRNRVENRVALVGARKLEWTS